MEARVVWIDGSLVGAAEATVPLLAQSLQRGTLVFDVYAVEHLATGPHGFGAREHTERFLHSAELMDYPVPYEVDELLTIAGQVVRANPGCDSLRLNVLWAEPSIDLLPRSERASVAVAAYAVAELSGPASARPARPARLLVPGLRKVPDDVLPVQAKVAASYAHASVAKRRARRAGYDDVLLLDGAGDLAEIGTMSLFLVADGRLLVPGLDAALDGVTRRAVLDLADDEGIDALVGSVPLRALGEADEAFLTSTTRNIWPVGLLGERELASPGPVTAQLTDRLAAVLRGADRLSARWLQPL